ncbi:mitogen-activated protein kinase 7-like [Anneissia japonica]|uniref:mitogen-activated protein kinase 7-like n=1 Tax=Anneissia japonica TaxID=1529436 RepID=UPI00142553BD|nr:mitogen-activated protein kinase 7-like [Anneissia japonica]
MESDLHQIIHSKQTFSEEHVRYFLYQLLRGLKYIHSANVIHRDLKPSNLLVNGNCELKIGDFGMARGVSFAQDHKRQMRMTNYVATRWYRAPELLFPMEHYVKSVDMWSVGCILAEMIGRKQIFPGKNLIDQLTLVTQVLGLPPDSMLQSCHSDQIFNFFHKNYGHMKPIDWKTKYPTADSQALNLLSKMLMYNPEERVTSSDALKHPYLAKYHDPLDEPLCFPQFDFSFENEKMDKEQVRGKVIKIIEKYHRHKKTASKVPLGSFMKPTQRVCGSVSNQKGIINVSQPGLFIPHTVVENLQNTRETLTQSLAQGETDKQASSVEGKGTGTINAPQINIQNTAQDSEPIIVNGEDSKRGLLVATQQNTTDVEMKSALSVCGSAQISSQEITSNGSHKNSLLPQESSDVVMRSASREDSISELPQQQVADLQNLNAKAVSGDVAMKSAKDSGDVCIPKVQGPQINTENSQKTISTDTKALIKAALLNAAHRNKMQASKTDLTKTDPKAAPVGGRKMSVKAWERQKEREEKRKNKLKKATERQKKMKAKNKQQENQGLFLTQEDRDMLERWNKMRASAQESKDTGSVSIKQWKSEPNIQNSIKSKMQGHQPQGNTNSVKSLVNPSTSGLQGTGGFGNKDTNGPATFVLAGQGQAQCGQQVQIKLTQPTTFVIKNTANMAPNSRVKVRQNLKPIAPKQEHKPQCANIQSQNTRQGTNLFNQVPVVASDVKQPASSQNLPNIDQGQMHTFSSTDMLNDMKPSAVPPNEALSPHYQSPGSCSPSFAQHGSPPTYEEALEAKQKPPTKMSPLLRDEFLMASDSFGASTKVSAPDLFKNVVPPAGFYKDPNSPPDIASVTHQLSKSGMIDVLPPLLQLTPRGDGAGYGLTMDLEELLNQSLDMQPPLSTGKCESGPLSASLLSDWLDLHNLNPADLHAVQQEIGLSSPFAMATLPDVTRPSSKDK